MNIDHQEVIDATLATVGSKVTYSSAGAAVVSWVLNSDLAVLVSLSLGIAGFLINWYYRYKADKRAQAEHYAKMGMYE